MVDYALEGPKWGSAAYGSSGGTVTWAADASVPASFVSVLSAAFADWSARANILFKQVASTAQSQIDFDVSAIDGLNNVLGETNYTASGRSFLSAAVTFDSGEGWHASGSKIVSNASVDLFAVALHEIGHALGLDHYNATAAVMNSVLNRSITDLTNSDINGIHALYGAAVAATTASGAMSGASSTTIAAGTTPTTGATPTTLAAHDVYRFYDTTTGDHFYTTDPSEKASIQGSLPTFRYEGAAFASTDKGAGTVDIYRFYDTVSGNHFFTASTTERDGILKSLPTFHYEGVAFEAHADASTPGAFALERFYNASTGQHHYATPQEAANMLAGSAGPGWIDEGKAFVVHAPSGALG